MNYLEHFSAGLFFLKIKYIERNFTINLGFQCNLPFILSFIFKNHFVLAVIVDACHV